MTPRFQTRLITTHNDSIHVRLKGMDVNNRSV